VVQDKILIKCASYALFLSTIAHLLLQTIERFVFFGLGVLIKSKAMHFNNILKRSNKIIGFRAVQVGIYHNMVDGQFRLIFKLVVCARSVSHSHTNNF
jgi:hypothetical protein